MCVQQGFTLLELMIVLAILGVLLTVAIPSFKEWREHSAVNNAANAIFVKLKQARSLAVAESRDVKMKFVLSDPYSFVYDDNGGVTCSLCKKETYALRSFSPKLVLKRQGGSTLTTFSRKGTANSSTTKVEINGYYKCLVTNVIGRTYMLGIQPASVSATSTEGKCRDL
jgi:type II secretion system protein H